MNVRFREGRINMFLRTTCPSCREVYELTEQQRGHKVLCPECNTLFAPEVEEVPEDESLSDEPEERRRRRKNRPRRLRPVRPPIMPVLLIVGLCVLAVLVGGTALVLYLVRSGAGH
jgi:predicted Zn finger-like uncharacterized protein